MIGEPVLNGQYSFEEWMIHDLAAYAPANEVSRATVFALANGYMSSRGAPESAPLDMPGVVGHHVNGLYDTPSGGILDREMINLPAWTPIRLMVGEQVLDLTNHSQYRRTLDMNSALLQQTFGWHLGGEHTLTVHSERMVSMARPHLAAIRWQIAADTDCDLTLHSSIDAAVTNRFADTHFATITPWAEDTQGHVEVATFEPGYRVVVAAAHALSTAAEWIANVEAQRAVNTITLHVRAHQTVTLIKWVAVYDSRFASGDLVDLVERELDSAQAAGYDAVYAQHVARWAALWDASDVVIEGDDQAQIALRFCLFHLLANVPHSDQVSVSARGLQGQDYWGSIFWDCEIYVLPFYTYTQPEYARRSLMYRHATLDGARRKAQSLGFRGAYYAWQSQETGDETCALYVFTDPRTGEKLRSYFADEQIHISADVVYALSQYVQATGDWAFMARHGLEIACEVARFFVSRAVHNAEMDRYELRTVLGPDEYHERVDNNTYTNALARFSLEVALDALEAIRRSDAAAYERVAATIGLTDDEIAAWRTVIAHLYIPEPDPASGLIAQFDGYFALEDALPDVVRPRLAHPDLYPGGPHGPYQSTQSIKQADVVLLLYLLRHQYSRAVKEANWRYYEPRTAHDSSLSPMAYALVAADVGMAEWAYRYFMHTALVDLLGSGPHWNLGVHTAALGGAWQTVVNGFCQIDLRSDGVVLHGSPMLPAHWQRVSFGFFWHGHYVRFSSDGRHTSLAAESGPVPVIYPGGQTEISPGHAFIFSEDKTL